MDKTRKTTFDNKKPNQRNKNSNSQTTSPFKTPPKNNKKTIEDAPAPYEEQAP